MPLSLWGLLLGRHNKGCRAFVYFLSEGTRRVSLLVSGFVLQARYLKQHPNICELVPRRTLATGSCGLQDAELSKTHPERTVPFAFWPKASQ